MSYLIILNIHNYRHQRTVNLINNFPQSFQKLTSYYGVVNTALLNYTNGNKISHNERYTHKGTANGIIPRSCCIQWPCLGKYHHLSNHSMWNYGTSCRRGQCCHHTKELFYNVTDLIATITNLNMFGEPVKNRNCD